MSNLFEYIQETLYPSLLNNISTAFPLMKWEKKGSKWLSPLHLDGSPSKSGAKARTYINTTGALPFCVGEIDGGGALSLFKYALQYHGYSPEAPTMEQRLQVVGELCKACGLVMPDFSTDEYKKDREREDKVLQLYKDTQAALFSPEGAAVLSYLTNERGYSEKDIKAMGLGYISKEMALRVNEQRLCLSYNPSKNEEIQSGQAQSLPYYVGKTHTLVIPYTSGGRVRGFSFRVLGAAPITANGKEIQKYLNNTGLPKSTHLFGLSGLTLTGNKEKDRDITIVEGQLDALHAKVIGLDNVVAAAGGVLSVEALQAAKGKGVKRVTILFDTEETAEKQKETEAKKQKAIETAYSMGLVPFVAALPTDGDKVDVDSYLKDHSKEELKAIIDNAQTAPLYQFERITDKARERQGEAETLTQKGFDDYKSETIALANSQFVSPTDRETIFATFHAYTGEYITKEALQQEADALKAAKDLQDQRNETLRKATEAFTLAKDGKIAEAIKLMGESAPELQAMSTQTEFRELLSVPTAEGILKKLSVKPTGIETNYIFGQNSRAQRLVIPSGAMTFICAPTSHGKSKMLQNLALQLAQEETREGAVLYFTFEEDAESVIEQLENNFIGVRLSRNNLRTIRTLHTTGKYFADKNSELDSKAKFEYREGLFLKFISSGKLRVFYKDYDSTKLINAIKFICSQIKVKAVFVDYVQLLTKGGCKLQRTEEVKEICKDFKALAVDYSLPVVMGAQLNREAKSPIEMSNQNISEASDIEKIANTIVCIWNSSFYPLIKSEWVKYKETLRGEPIQRSTEQHHIEQLGFEIGKSGQLYCVLTKNREGERGLDCVLKFRGNTGQILSNEESSFPEDQRAKQTDFINNLMRK